MSESDLYKDESCKWTLAQATQKIDFHLRKLMEISGTIESRGMKTSAIKMCEHIFVVDDMFSLIFDQDNDPEIRRSSNSRPT